MQAMLQYTAQALNEAGIDCVHAEGGFYVMADFSSHKIILNANNICTGSELSRRLLHDIGVAALPGCDFGLAEDSLILRLAMVDFDGSAALHACLEDYQDRELDIHFLQKYLKKSFRASAAMIDWFKALS